ncbi:MAG: hypothetical protein IPM18_00845 [Phycisphaerales bacterium]|nr:hypothetical protein [Phycisphaerales bacterium]
METWTRERVIRELLAHEARGRRLSSNDVETKLYQAAGRLFGSWHHALLAAGISPARVRALVRWPREKILAVIVAIAHQSRRLGQDELRRRHGGLMKAAEREFGSWPKAVATAGVTLVVQKRTPPWTRESVIQAILERSLKNAPLGSTTVQPPSLAAAAKRVFGTWRAALESAGIRTPAPRAAAVPARSAETGAGAPDPAARQRWTAQIVVDALLARLRDGKKMNALAVYAEHPGLYRAALRNFANWRNALASAGLNPEEFWRGATAPSETEPSARP